MSEATEPKSLNFIEQIIEEDLANNKNNSRVLTRFPPEPNGYLHIGHAKSICLNFGLGINYKGKTNLRFDDTNPSREEQEYVDSIMEDVRWLGFEWDGEPHYASDYFEQLYDWAVMLIKKGLAYVDDQSAEVISAQKGSPTRPGIDSPYRSRSVDENLDLFARMRAGEFKDGEKILRAKIDMASPNMHLRDPNIYRIKHAHHQRTGDKWCIYPMYDFAHGQSDYIEGITHSICTLEFEVHRPLYDWCLDQIVEGPYRPRQIEFARLNLSYTIMSKRKLLQLVEEKYVDGWDDPRMPTVSGLRRRGYTAESIRNFAEKVGVARRENMIDVALLEYAVREDLNKKAERRMAVVDPIKVVITNYPEGQVELLDAINNPENEAAGSRKIPFEKYLYIERDDFMEEAPKKYFRLTVGAEVRLRYAYFITCESVIKNEAGEIIELHCTYDPLSKGGNSPDGRKVKGTIHWVPMNHSFDAQVMLYDRLFVKENPDDVEEGQSFLDNMNPNSLSSIHAKAEPALKEAKAGESYQFERIGYFCVDKYSEVGKPVFNKTVGLKDSWAKANA